MASTNLFFLLDLSGSMTMNGRLNQINDAIPDVLGAVQKKVAQLEVSASVRIIYFNSSSDYIMGSAEKGVDLTTAISQWKDVSAGSSTRTGLAIEKVIEAMHTRYLLVDGDMDSVINAPVVILFTDGECNDSFKPEFKEKINELKSKRRTKSGKETILRIAIGVNDANKEELEEFASVWPTVVGYDSEGNPKVEDKKQVYMIDDAEDITDLLSNLTVSSVVSTSTPPVEDENGNEKPAPINITKSFDDITTTGNFSDDFSDFK
ncbi:vWA domain-containing protein [Eubacterium sp.]|uniref:vWA domain-containing protein n=1 Tax=Eubacterium sp. TaxID=142586 RepID=UPI0025FE00E5|nr:vWA domain-containing protein [Eubacterium sp.]MCR5629708.1 VWA domain-containing protein [Eubacterium sp.]